MFERLKPIRNPVTIWFDGRKVEAEAGEPLAVALLAAGEAVVARSPKLHRPRGPACLRRDCDGCLARVDGVPNVMTCARTAQGDERITVQNVLGTRKTDLLRITDWFFPRGIDHHHLMAGIPGVGSAMQTFARQMAGIGRLPDEVEAVRPAKASSCDVLVVGGGLSGLACAAALTSAGIEVVLVDEAAELGGAALADASAVETVAGLVSKLGSARVLSGATLVGIYSGKALVDLGAKQGALTIAPRRIVLATGAHDGVLTVPNNDLPGVMGARAVSKLARAGIVPRGRAVIVGAGVWFDITKAALGERVARGIDPSQLESIRGGSRVSGVRTKSGEAIACEVVACATDLAPSFQLAVQAGAQTRVTDAGFAVQVDEHGRAAEGVWATGECTGLAYGVEALVQAGEKVARVLAGRGEGPEGRAAGDRTSTAQPSMTASNKPSPPAQKMKPNRPIKEK